MGMLFARRKKNKVEGVTTTKNLLNKEPRKVESVQPQRVRSIPTQGATNSQPKFKV
jgi:hypothetical protein